MNAQRLEPTASAAFGVRLIYWCKIHGGSKDKDQRPETENCPPKRVSSIPVLVGESILSSIELLPVEFRQAASLSASRRQLSSAEAI
jgi:hypothetical protein